MILISINAFAEAEDAVCEPLYSSQSNKLIFAQLRRGSTYTPPPRPPQYQGGNQAAPGKNQPYQRPTLPPRQLVPRSAQAPPPGSRRYNLPPEVRRNPIKAAPRNIPVKLSSWDRPLPSANLLSSPTTTYSARAKLLSSVPAANLLPAKSRIQKVELDQKIRLRLIETKKRVREVLERAKIERRYSPGGKSDPRHPENSRLLAKNLASVSQMGETGEIIAGPGSKKQKPFRDAPRAAALYGGRIEDWVKKSSFSYVNPEDETKFQTHWIENLKSGERLEFKTIVNEEIEP